MPHYLQIVCLFVLCIPHLSFAQNDSHPLLEKRIDIELTNQKIEKVLDEISSKSGLYFSYDPTVFNAQQLVSVNHQNQKIGIILEELFYRDYSFQVLKNQVIITKFEPEKEKQKTKQTKNFEKFSGYIHNVKSQEPIPYASISILGKPIGTISNMDGEFEVKIPNEFLQDTLLVSCLGFQQFHVPLVTAEPTNLKIALNPVDIHLKEIKVTAINPLEILDKMIDRIPDNYPETNHLMTAFYREVLLQDEVYTNVSEAVMNILKPSYKIVTREDRVKFLKGRKSNDVTPFKWVDFKMQGGPYYITKLDVIKTMDTFISPEFRHFYTYEAQQVITYLDRPTYVIHFTIDEKVDFVSYEGKLFIDQENCSLVRAEFSLTKQGKRIARRSLIKKKPRSFHVRPLDLNYQVTYKETDGKWHLNSAQTSVKFRVRSKHDKINSVFHSVADLLITDHTKTEQRRFDREETYSPSDVFTELIIDYDPDFWGQYNIIKPDENLQKAVKRLNNSAAIKSNAKKGKYYSKNKDNSSDSVH